MILSKTSIFVHSSQPPPHQSTHPQSCPAPERLAVANRSYLIGKNGKKIPSGKHTKSY